MPRSYYCGSSFGLFALSLGLFSVLLPLPAMAQTPAKKIASKIAPNKLWQKADIALALPDNQTNPLTSRLTAYTAYQVNMNTLLAALKQAPLEYSVDLRQSPAILSLPMPDGTFSRFYVLESSIVSPEIAAAHPEIKTYLAQGIDDPTATARLDHTPDGFHAMILSPNGQVFIDPYVRGDQARYVSYFKADMLPDPAGFQCMTQGNNAPANELHPERRAHPLTVTGTMLRKYRLALSCTAEYAAKFGGTMAGAMNAMTTSINRVDGVYETEVAIRMTIVKFNIYTAIAGEPFTNNDGGSMLGQNQTVCDGANTTNTGPGNANYDFGHVFSTGGGGLAYVGVICQSGSKAGGVTGSSSPSGDGFDIDYVAHEMGHQFGADHTFNGTSNSCGGGNRSSSDAYEPGSGSTIMAYAGICSPEDLQPHSDAYFHTKSFDEIVAYTNNSSGNGCSVRTSTGNNPPAVNPGVTFTIPQNTPFMLTANGSDPDSDPLTYCWEEFDLGAATPPANTGTGLPLFRSYKPTTSPSRVFPRLSDLLANAATPWEVLPTANKTLNFRVTVRDNRAGGGGVNYAASKLIVSGAAFALSNRTSTMTWTAGTSQTVTWTVGGGSVASKVNILLSTDGGTTFNPLSSNIPNSGGAVVTVPLIASTAARLMIQAVGDVFFDVSRVKFTIVNPAVSVSGTLAFEGIVSGAASQNVTFVFRPTSGGSTFTRSASVAANGAFTLTAIPRGAYNIWIKGDKYLAQIAPVDASAGNVSGITATLPTGDANNDNLVDVTDFGLLVGAYGSSSSVPGSGYDLAEDFNGDGLVDVTDFGLLVGNYGANGAL